MIINNIYCIGRNYLDHARELKNEVPPHPIVFLKSNTCLRSLHEDFLAFDKEIFDHELEVVVKVGSNLKLNQQAQWRDVAAIALGIDLTRRTVQSQLKAKGLPWTLAKSFWGSAIITDFITKEQFPDLEAIEFTLKTNGILRQSGSSKDMIFSVPQLLTYICSFCPLVKNDLIFTGTPSGVGSIKKGDLIEMEFPQINQVFRGKC